MVDVKEKCERVVSEIKQLHPGIEQTIPKLLYRIAALNETGQWEQLRKSGEYWTFRAYADAFIKLRLIIEQNFMFVETLGLLAVTRYVFEALVWLRVLQSDSESAFCYGYQVIDGQLEHHKRYLKEVRNRHDDRGARLVRLGADRVLTYGATIRDEGHWEHAKVGRPI